MTRPSDQHPVEKDTDAHEPEINTNDQPPENNHVAGDGDDVEHGPHSAGGTASFRSRNLRRPAQALPEGLTRLDAIHRTLQMSKDNGHAMMAEDVHDRPSSSATLDPRVVRVKGLEDEVDSLRNELGDVKHDLTIMQEAVDDYEFDSHVTRADLSKTMLEVKADRADRQFEFRMITNELQNLSKDFKRLTKRLEYFQGLIKDYEKDCPCARSYAKALEARIDGLEARIGAQKSPDAQHRQIPGRPFCIPHRNQDNLARNRGGFLRAGEWKDRARVGRELGHDADFLTDLKISQRKNQSDDGTFRSLHGFAPQWSEESKFSCLLDHISRHYGVGLNDKTSSIFGV